MRFQYIKTVCIIMVLSISTFLFSQEEIVKEHFNKDIGDGIVLLKEIDHVKDEVTFKTMVVTLKQGGEFYLSTFILSPKNQVIDVFVDDNRFQKRVLVPHKNGWQTCLLQSKKSEGMTLLKLLSGEHKITFSNGTAVVPIVDEIKLSTSLSGVDFNKRDFLNWHNSLKSNTLPPNYTEQKNKGLVSITNNQIATKNLTLGESPLYKYTGYLDINYSYTYRGRMQLVKGLYAQFWTENPSAGTDPVMYVYKENDPENYSWTNDDGNGNLQPRLDLRITNTGYYAIIVRSYGPLSSGTADVVYNNTTIQSGATIAGNVYSLDETITSGLKNYFTCSPNFTSKDTYMWLFQSGSLGQIRAYNDDYYSTSGNFDWNYYSRIKSSLTHVDHVLVAAYSSSGNSVCDLYLGNNMSNIMPYFENLEADDAIKSADASGTYNCISWSGGVTREWFWPPSPGNPYYCATSVRKCFDNYYANRTEGGVYTPRHLGTCWDYTRTGATYSNSIVDLWHNPNFPFDSGYTHGSCRKPANDHMHGYDWESKPGDLTRTFHPRHDLKSFGTWDYGDVKYYYKYASGTALASKEMTDAEAIAVGLQVVPPREQFSSDEALKLNNLINSVSVKDSELFTKYREALDYELKNNMALRIHSNPAFYKQTKEYQAFITHCKKLGDKALPLLFRIISSDDHFIYREAINDLCYDEYGHILQEIVDDYVYNGQKTTDGKFVGFSHENTMMKFAKRILNEEF